MSHSILQRCSVLGLLFTGLALSGCSSLSHKKDEQAVQQIKSVAVVAFQVQRPAPAGIGLNLSGGGLGATQNGSIIPQHDENTDKMYSDLVSAFSEKLKWNVMKPEKMKSQAGYLAAYKKTMEGWQNKMGPGAGIKQFIVDGVMDFDGPRILDVAGRDQLIDALGVDALVVSSINVYLDGTTVMGIGGRHPVSRLSFMVYRKGDASPVWFEGNIDGEKEESVGKTGFWDEELLAKLAVKSARTAYAKIGDTNVQ
jgi:hypothetical protein